MIGLLMVLMLGGAKTKPKPPPVVKPPAEAVKPADPWEFDGLTARVFARADAADDLTQLAITQLNVPLEGDAQFKVSAHANTVGGVTLTLQDPNDPKTSCALYATKDGEGLTFNDSRCTFTVSLGQTRAQATCRKITGTARRAKDAILVEATTPDCNSAPMGVPVSVRASVKPVIR